MKLAFSCNVPHLIPGLRLPLLYSTSTSINSGTINSSFSEFLHNSLGFDYNQSINLSDKLTKWRRSTEVKDVNSSIDNANSVVNYFKQLGFNHSQIKKLIDVEPRFLMSSVDNSLKPKVMLLKELGVSDSELIRIVSTNYQLLRIKLEPVIDALRTVLGSDDNVVVCLKRQSYFGCYAHLLPNVQLFCDYCGIRVESVAKYVQLCPRVFLLRTELFGEVVSKVELKLGIPRGNSMFVYGVHLLANHHEKRLEDKIEMFKSFGWTQSQVTELIIRNPCVFNSSQSMIKKKLDFLMNHVGYTPDYLMTRVSLFTSSVDKRLAPRYRILQILKEKGKANWTLDSASVLTEPLFVKKIVLPFEEVHEVYAQLTGSAVGSLDVGREKGQS